MDPPWHLTAVVGLGCFRKVVENKIILFENKIVLFAQASEASRLSPRCRTICCQRSPRDPRGAWGDKGGLVTDVRVA